MKVEHLDYAKASRQFVLAMNRFAWEADAGRRARPTTSGGSACCIFARVTSVKAQGIDPRKTSRRAVAAGDPLRAGRRARRDGRAGVCRRRARSGSTSNASRRGSPISAAPGSAASRPVAPSVSDRRWRSRFSQSDPDFEARFAAFLATKREVSAGGRRRRARHHRDGARRGRRGAHRLYADNSTGPISTALGIAVSKADIAAAYAAADADGDRGADASRATASTRITSGSGRPTTATPIRSASSSARAGRRSRRSASTCRAARRAIRARC